LHDKSLIGHPSFFYNWLAKISSSPQQQNLRISPGNNYSQYFPSKECGEKYTEIKGSNKSMITGTQIYLETINRKIRIAEHGLSVS
jgi:hypothetical protein